MTQKDALEIMHSGKNIFLTGEPGAGKTHVLNQFIEETELKVAVTASTGIAASHIGGTTIHSWSGLGIAEDIGKEDLQRLKNTKPIRKRYEKTDVLVIDEVSMLHGKRLDMVEMVARYIRGGSQPFGGMQVILVGDLFQLPPVSRNSNEFDFVHKSRSWYELAPEICYLTEQHRQDVDDRLLELLRSMRSGKITIDQIHLLKGRSGASFGEGVTKLFTHNVDVDEINQDHLDAIKSKSFMFQMTSSGNNYRVEQMKKSILAPEVLELKVGAEVMFVANNHERRCYNGTRGIVKKFTKAGEPIVQLWKSDRTIKVEMHSWKIKEDDRVIAEVEQLPLRLAWAITVHKSQGMSLDAAEVDLSRAFTPGMGYVALSRVRSLDGLFLQGFNDMSLKMHPEIYEFDAVLRNASETVKA